MLDAFLTGPVMVEASEAALQVYRARGVPAGAFASIVVTQRVGEPERMETIKILTQAELPDAERAILRDITVRKFRTKEF